MIKIHLFYLALFTASLTACGTEEKTSATATEASENTPKKTKETQATKIELSFNLPDKESEQLKNATATIGESYNLNCFSFKGDNATLDIYLNSFDLVEKEYPINVEDMSSPDILVSYKISSNGETSDCCGKVEKESKGGMTITSITDEVISGTIDVDNYDGSAIKGSFSITL